MKESSWRYRTGAARKPDSTLRRMAAPRGKKKNAELQAGSLLPTSAVRGCRATEYELGIDHHFWHKKVFVLRLYLYKWVSLHANPPPHIHSLDTVHNTAYSFFYFLFLWTTQINIQIHYSVWILQLILGMCSGKKRRKKKERKRDCMWLLLNVMLLISSCR